MAIRASIRGLALLSLAVALCAGPAAAQDASALFDAGGAAFADGDYGRALSLFEEARDAGSRGPAVHYNIGVCRYRLGDYAGSAEAFRYLADNYPSMRGLALYNLGLARLRQQRDEEARALFGQAAREAGDDKVAALAGAMLRRTAPAAPAPSASSWFALADANVGYDDNVALLDESSVPATQSVDSAFVEAFGVLSGPRRATPGWRFDGSAYAVRYGDASEYDQTAVRAAGLYAWSLRDWRVEAGPQLSYSTLDGDGFEQRVGVGARLRRPLSRLSSIAVRVELDRVDEGNARFAYLAGSRQRLELTWDRRLASGRLTLGYDLERNDRDDPAVSPTRNRVWTRYRYTAAADWSADVRLALRRSRYGDLAVPRDDDRADLSVGYLRRLARGWEVNARYLWSDNDSDVGVYAYTRSRVAVGVTKVF